MKIQGNITIQLTPQEFTCLMNVIEDHVCEYSKAGDFIIEIYNKMQGLTK